MASIITGVEAGTEFMGRKDIAVQSVPMGWIVAPHDGKPQSTTNFLIGFCLAVSCEKLFTCPGSVVDGRIVEMLRAR